MNFHELVKTCFSFYADAILKMFVANRNKEMPNIKYWKKRLLKDAIIQVCNANDMNEYIVYVYLLLKDRNFKLSLKAADNHV